MYTLILSRTKNYSNKIDLHILKKKAGQKQKKKINFTFFKLYKYVYITYICVCRNK